MIGDDKDFIREILCDFQHELEDLTKKIINGFEKGDIDCLQQHVHNLRGISGSVCATELHAVLNSIDEAVRCRNMSLANSFLSTFLSSKNAAADFLSEFLNDESKLS